MTSEGLGEMFESDSEDMCAGKFPLVSMGGRAEGLACADPGARTPIGASGIFNYIFSIILEMSNVFNNPHYFFLYAIYSTNIIYNLFQTANSLFQ